MKPISLSFPNDKLQALDADGKPILTSIGAGEQEVNVTPLMTSIELDLPFGLPDRSIKNIATLRGTMIAMILGRQEQFTFTALKGAQNIEQRKSGATVTLQQVRKNLQLTEVRVRVKFDKAENALESHRGWASRNQAYMLDADGKVVEFAAEEAFLLGDDEIGRVYLFDIGKGLDGYKFVYSTPGMIIKKPIRFELKDIELP
ncbi:MAG: hypothetical protein IH991_17865 [Planctomycetes bacterium]|nr:hypothetical protein [Planctomycetota bacterium]